MGKNEEKWMEKYEALKALVQKTGHFSPKHTTLCAWQKYQRKRLKAGLMTEEQKRLFLELCGQRTNEHTGGRRKKSSPDAN